MITNMWVHGSDALFPKYSFFVCVCAFLPYTVGRRGSDSDKIHPCYSQSQVIGRQIGGRHIVNILF